MSIFDLIAGNGQSGGLLDFLKQNADAAIRGQSTGAPGDEANYDAPAPAPQSLVQAATAPAAAPDNSAIQDALWKAKQATQADQAPAAPVAGPMALQAPAAPVAAPAAGQAPGLTSGPSIFAPQTTNAFGQSQAGPISSGLQTFARALGNMPRGGMDAPEVIAQRQKDQATALQTAQTNQTAATLVKRGVDPALASAAVLPGNGELLKGLIDKTLGVGRYTQETDKDGNIWNIDANTGQKTIALAAKSDKYQPVTTTNPDGTKTTQLFNTDTKEFIKPPGSDAPATGKFSVPDELTGPERLQALEKADPMYARKIKAMVAGDMPLPTGVAALKPDAKRIIEDVLAVDGATSASDFQTRAATRKDYASGVASRVTKSINTTIGHFATLDNAVDKLGNYSYFPKLSNYVHDAYSSNTDPNYQKAKAAFETNKEAAVKELDFALSGGHSSVSGSAEIRDKFNRADSPEALHAAITEAMSLLQKRLDSHTKAFVEGTKSQRNPQDFIYPENRQAFSKLLGASGEGNTNAGVEPGTQPGTYNIGGSTYTIQKAN